MTAPPPFSSIARAYVLNPVTYHNPPADILWALGSKLCPGQQSGMDGYFADRYVASKAPSTRLPRVTRDVFCSRNRFSSCLKA